MDITTPSPREPLPLLGLGMPQRGAEKGSEVGAKLSTEAGHRNTAPDAKAWELHYCGCRFFLGIPLFFFLFDEMQLC